MNMDGIEWKRDKWSKFSRLWLRANERAGELLSDHLVADHPVIREHHLRHVNSKKITMIPYGATHSIIKWKSVPSLCEYKLDPFSYALVIARVEPDNSILEIVQAFSDNKRGIPWVILGNFDRSKPYHASVLDAASHEVFFVGAIYDRDVVRMLRSYAKVYIHGHRVGGTNPSLVESLAAGNPVIAHDNPFTRWVAGDKAKFFGNREELSSIFDQIFSDDAALAAMSQASLSRYSEDFIHDVVLQEYEDLLSHLSKQQ
jgi:glycosyltransferase involved in cell wall biosynthesis